MTEEYENYCSKISIKRMIIYAFKLFYNGFLFYWTFQIIRVLLVLINAAQTPEQTALYGILLIVSMIAVRIPLVSLKYYNFRD